MNELLFYDWDKILFYNKLKNFINYPQGAMSKDTRLF